MAITTPRFFNRLLLSLFRYEWVRRMQRRFPTVFRWIVRRFDSSHFAGLPLTLTLGILAINGMIFSEIAQNIVNSEPMVQVDQQVGLFLFARHSLLLSIILLGITQLASQSVSVGLTLLAAIRLLWKKQRLNASSLNLVMMGVGVSVYYGKLYFHRVRSLKIAYHPDTTFSFPSVHSTTAMALYGLLAFFLARETGSFRKRFIVGLLGICLILAVGFSRIYLGVHFLSDVAGGYLVGATWLVLGVSLVEWNWYCQRLILP